MFTNWLRRTRRSTSRISRPALEVEILERRDCPSTSPFFIDKAAHGVWAATDGTGKVYQFTGIKNAVQLSVGDVSQTGGGGQFAAVRTSSGRVVLFNGNNNVVTVTDTFAKDAAAGRGRIYLRHQHNRVEILSLGAALNGDGTFNVTPIATTATARQMEVGFDFTTAQDFLAYRSRNSTFHVLELVAGVPVYGDTSKVVVDLEPGNQKETFVRSPHNRVSVFTINTVAGTGITLFPEVVTAAFAVQMSVSRNNPAGDDYMAYIQPNSTLHFMNYAPATHTVSLLADIPGVKAQQVEAGVTEIFIRDFHDQVRYYTLNGSGTGIAAETKTGVLAVDLRVTKWTLGPGVIDQIAIIKASRRLFVSQNDGGGSAIASFFDTGFLADDVQGYAAFP